jgi:AraC-like DNA-binding protein
MGNNLFGLFGRSIAGVDCPGREKCTRGYNLCGTCYRIFDRGCHGHLWVCDGGSFSVTRFDITFTEDCIISADLPGCILIACFKYGPKTENGGRRILCCCGSEESERRSQMAFTKGSRVTGTEITLTGHFCEEKFAGVGHCGRYLREAFANTDKQQEHSELNQIFDQLNVCEFPIPIARMYYESKAIEALAVLSAGCDADVFEAALSPDLDVDGDFKLQMKRYIDENSNSELTVEVLAKIACMSPSKLKYCFKRSFNRNIYEYVTEIRMEKAKRLLADTDLAIEIVASEIGYKKSGAFAAAFRKYAGILPKEYRSAGRTEKDASLGLCADRSGY